MTAAKPAIDVSTDSAAETARSQTRVSVTAAPATSICERLRTPPGIHRTELAKGRNAMAIWQDLVDGHGFAGGYQSVKRFVGKLCGVAAPEARVVIKTAPGEEAQVDYGPGPMVRDPQAASTGGRGCS